jgi:hypothetical protein
MNATSMGQSRTFLYQAYNCSNYPMVRRLATLMLQREDHTDLSFDFHCLPIQDVRSVPPLLDRADRRGNQKGMTAQRTQLRNSSLCVDHGSQQNGAFGTRVDRNLWIDRLHLLDEHAGVETRDRHSSASFNGWAYDFGFVVQG